MLNTFLCNCLVAFFDLCSVESNMFRKALIIVITSLLFKGTNDAFMLKISKTLNKNWDPFLYLFVSCISARSLLKMLFLIDGCILR